jgi:uncharacterized surface protein with fasciclin (FAS1) repeats
MPLSHPHRNVPHPAHSKFTADDVLAMDLPIDVPTVGGAMLKIATNGDGGVIVGGQKVILPNIMASNGIIHGIAGVITDPTL